MSKEDGIYKIKDYLQKLDKSKLSKFETEIVNAINKHGSSAVYFDDPTAIQPDIEDFINVNKSFAGLFPPDLNEKNTEVANKLCVYLRHLSEFTCNRTLIRMDARSENMSYYVSRIKNAVFGFLEYAVIGWDLKKIIYDIKEENIFSMVPIISTELFLDNGEAIEFCRDVLVSGNNTAIMSWNLIRAIGQSKNEELQGLLINMLLAAKLQEGFRQAVLETCDEGQLEYFLKIIKVIKGENLLRFSSVKRAVMTWIGIGYETPEDKEIKFIFDKICDCVFAGTQHCDESSDGSAAEVNQCTEQVTLNSAQLSALSDENPISVYIGLYSIGMRDVDIAIAKAVELLDDDRKHIVAAAIIYLMLTCHFDPLKFDSIYKKHQDDRWIMGLYFKSLSNQDFEKTKLPPDQAKEIFYRLAKQAESMKDTEKYKSKGFEWFSIELYRNNLVWRMIELINTNADPNMVEAVLPYIANVYSYRKGVEEFMDRYFRYVPEDVRKTFMTKEIISANTNLSKWIAGEFKRMNLSEKDIIALEGRLKTKKEFARALILSVIANQSEEIVRASMERLQASSNIQIQECAQELKLLAARFFDEEEIDVLDVKGASEGFGLYEPLSCKRIPYDTFFPIVKRGFFKKKEMADLAFASPLTKEQIIEYIRLWDERIIAHEEDEYEIRGDFYRISLNNYGLQRTNWAEDGLDGLPLSDLWHSFFDEDNLSVEEVYQIGMHLNTDVDLTKVLPAAARPFVLVWSEIEGIKYFPVFRQVFRAYIHDLKVGGKLRQISARYTEMIHKYVSFTYTEARDYRKELYLKSLGERDFYLYAISGMNIEETTEEEFRRYFPLFYEAYIKYQLALPENVRGKFKLSPLMAARATRLGMITEESLIEIILNCYEKDDREYYYSANHQISRAYNECYGYGRRKPDFSREKEKDAEFLKLTLDKIARTFIKVEAKRHNEKTELTPLMHCFRVLRGMDFLIIAAKVLEHEELTRNTYEDGRTAEFSNIIKNSYPVAEDRAEDLARCGFSEKRLVEIAMLAPQWIDIISEVIGWEGFKGACHYFIAHMKEYDMQQKKAQIAEFTNLEPEDLNDGAFDMDWCMEVAKTLGEDRMKIMYDSAKFLCTNSFHTRVKKYTDACLGKKPKEEFFASVNKSRSKDDLNAYCICPVTDDEDLLERYQRIQKFLKESKQFGAQRQASEKRTCEIALMNLSKNSKYENSIRLTWMMESEIVRKYQYALSPQEVEDSLIWIEFDDDGKNHIVCEKKGKRLKSVPVKLKKNPVLLDLKEIHKMWNEQYSRSKAMLETAMEEKTIFGADEIVRIMGNPVVSPMVSKLVLESEGNFGFYESGKNSAVRISGSEDEITGREEPYLRCPDGNKYPIGEKVRIAHPFDLYKAGVWKDFQREIFDLQMRQPFKQVFRELYLKLEDEIEKPDTMRYTGYQIQPQKAAGVLKSRRWNVSYESGLEKICYRDNIVVNLFAEADWFSPREIEAPSIDYVAFSSRHDHKPIIIGNIDDITFSEAMRDVDLAVSTAYVGGVDPITSFSTMELRKTIIDYTCQLMKLTNVTLEEHFAIVRGVHNKYRIHLGSGQIHQDGGPTIHVVPVYSGQRGKVYLPFIDEDPMTAQILTKVIMFAEDNKIKDPTILEQIVRKNSMEEIH